MRVAQTNMHRFSTPARRVRTCFFVSLICAAWNLFGDVCFIDFYLAHMTFEGFGTIDHAVTISRTGNIFDFNKAWPVKLAQASGWMYPIWALTTSYPLYVGLSRAGSWRCSLAPSGLLVYGLCVVGGALHSGFAFATILPKVLQQKSIADHCANDVVRLAQKRVMDTYVFGYTPGPIAVFSASLWIVGVVLTCETEFPKWFVLFTPLVTLTWVAAVGFLVMPEPVGFYFVGAFGTWIILAMNIAASCVLWNLHAKDGQVELTSAVRRRKRF